MSEAELLVGGSTSRIARGYQAVNSIRSVVLNTDNYLLGYRPKNPVPCDAFKFTSTGSNRYRLLTATFDFSTDMMLENCTLEEYN